MKKTLTFLFSILILLTSVFVIPASASYNNEVEFESDIVYVESLDKGSVIFNKNSNKRTAMASLTKITTALVVLDNCKDLNAKVTVSQKVLDTLAGTNSSTAGITAGEVLTVNQLLHLMLVKSANEAASILADYVGGDIKTFVGMMNDFAKARGCKNTHYENPHGLDADKHYTTAEDLAKIIKYGLKNDIFREMVGMPNYTLEKTNKRDTITYPNTNALLHSGSPYYYEYCKGIKTGTTDNAGSCLASYATKNGYSYLCIIISGSGKTMTTLPSGARYNTAFRETKKAYEWAFNNIKLKVVAKPTDVVTAVDVKLAKGTDHVRLVPSDEITALVPTNVDSSSILIVPIKGSIKEDIKAPIKAGDVLGQANVMYAEDTLYTIDLVAGEDVSLNPFAYFGYLVQSLFKSTLMKLVFALFIIAIVVILTLHFVSKSKKKRRKIHMVRMKNQSKGAGNRQTSNTKNRR